VADVFNWLGGTTRPAISEESVGLGSCGKVLTVLVSSQIGQKDNSDDEESEDDVIERWTPRFRR